MIYLAVLGRQPEISIAELSALFGEVKKASSRIAIFSTSEVVNIDRLGGSLKIAQKIDEKPLEFLLKLPEGKLTLGVSDYSKGASKKTATIEALKFKRVLVREGRSVRVVENKDAELSTATSLHNGLSGKNERKVELIKVENEYYRVVGVQDIDAYTRRDQARPARDAKVGMLPPKLAQILINLCGPLPEGATILDPFCGTGVVLQEALLIGYRAYGTDLSDRMVEYSKKNLKWLLESGNESSEGGTERGSASISAGRPWRSPLGTRIAEGKRAGRTRPEEDSFQIQQGDATSFHWEQPIDAVACEGYLGVPMSQIPVEIKLKTQKQECGSIILGFLKNLSTQIKSNTPVTIAIPAWLRSDGSYSRLEILDEIEDMGYNVGSKTREGLLYYRDGQIVARDIIILRKK